MGAKRFIYLLLLAKRHAGPTKAAANSHGWDKKNTAFGKTVDYKHDSANRR